ncbi:MAG TPA: DedA family protein [Candidatus Dormibacteraeota bacterium]
METTATTRGKGNMRRAAPFAGAAIFVALVLLVVAILEGDLPADLTGVRSFAHEALRRFGAAGALALLYIEESGIPLPVPGDVYVAYLGRLSDGEVLRFLAAWLGIIAVVTAGATNLYWISRRLGSRLVEHRFAPIFHLDSERVGSAERRFQRWGVLAIIFGRHVPGLRVPITVVAGIVKVPYPIFAPSVAISTAGWAGIWLYLGARYGRAISHFFGMHAWTYLVVVAVVVALVATAVVRGWRRLPPAPQTSGPS